MTTTSLYATAAQPSPPEDAERPGPANGRRPVDARVVVTLLTMVALGIRLVIVRGFWLDEATSGYFARMSYSGMLQQLTHDNHPPLDYTVLWFVSHSLGSTQTDLRLPSILFGTLTVPMLYLAGRALYDERVGLLAAAFGTVGALSVWYSQEARMYALFMLLATVTIWAQGRILATDGRRYWLAWTVAGAAMIWTQWFAALAVGAEIIFFLFVLGWAQGARRWERRATGPWYRPFVPLLTAVAAITVICAPGLPLLYTQYHNNQASGLGFGHTGGASGLSPYGILNNVVWALFGYHSNGVIAGAVAIWPVVLLGALVVLGRGRRTSRANRQLLTVALVPMALVFVASGYAAPNRSLFEIRYFVEAVPALYLLLAAAATHMTPNARSRRVVSGIILSLLGLGLVLQQTDGANPRLYGYDAAFRQISSVARPGDLILCSPSYLNVDVEYFEPSLRSAPATTTVPDLPLTTQIFVVTSPNFVGADQSSRASAQLVRRLGRTRHLNATFQAPNVTVWEFS